jgi:hypothetical protein
MRRSRLLPRAQVLGTVDIYLNLKLRKVGLTKPDVRDVSDGEHLTAWLEDGLATEQRTAANYQTRADGFAARSPHLEQESLFEASAKSSAENDHDDCTGI